MAEKIILTDDISENTIKLYTKGNRLIINVGDSDDFSGNMSFSKDEAITLMSELQRIVDKL